MAGAGEHLYLTEASGRGQGADYGGRTLKRTLRFSEVVGEVLEGGKVFGR